MNNKQLAKMFHKDAEKIPTDMGALVEDGNTLLKSIEDDLSQMARKNKEDLSVWAEDTLSQVSKGLEKITDDAKMRVADAAATMKKDVVFGLNQYNERAQDVADKVPGGFSRKAAKYPWVTISIAIFLGFLLGNLRSSIRQAHV